MQILILDPCPNVSATMIAPTKKSCKTNFHPWWYKFILEDTQILCTALRSLGFVSEEDKTFYKSYPHPCCVWAEKSSGNFNWILTHAMKLCQIFENIKGKKHSSEAILLKILNMKEDVLSSKKFKKTEFEPDFFVGDKNPLKDACIKAKTVYEKYSVYYALKLKEFKKKKSEKK